jgi:hypothetical protein
VGRRMSALGGKRTLNDQRIDQIKAAFAVSRNVVEAGAAIDPGAPDYSDLEDAHKPEHEHNDYDGDNQTENTAHCRSLQDVAMT